MKTLKKTLCLVLAVVMAVGVLVIPANAATSFPDDADITHDEAVAVLSGLGILKGDDEGNFNPEGILTRAQAAKIIAYMMLGEDDAEDYVASGDPFTDMADASWAVNYVAYCADNDIIGGNGDGTFTPGGELTGTAFAKMLLCAIGYDGEIEGFGGSNWAKNVESIARKEGLNDNLTSFQYSAPLTRDSAAQMAYNCIMKAEQVTGYTGGTDITLPGGVTITQGANRDMGVTLAEGEYSLYVLDGSDGYDMYSDTDDLGRPNKYQVAIAEINATATNKTAAPTIYAVLYTAPVSPAKTFTASRTASNIASDLKGYYVATGVKVENGSNKTWADTAEYVVTNDGTPAALTNDSGNDTTAAAISKLTDYGKTVEVYANSNKVITRIVVVENTLAQVTNVTSSKVTLKPVSPSSAAVSVEKRDEEGADNTLFEALSNYSKNDYLNIVLKGTSILDYSDVTEITGPLTAVTGDEANHYTTYTIDGTKYNVAHNAKTTWSTGSKEPGLDGDVNVVALIDANGYILDFLEATKAAPTYVYVVYKYEFGDSEWGDTNVKTYMFQGVLADGTTVVAEYDNTNSVEVTKQHVYKYTESDGVYTLKNADEGKVVELVAGEVKSSDKRINTNGRFYSSNVQTVFISGEKDKLKVSANSGVVSAKIADNNDFAVVEGTNNLVTTLFINGSAAPEMSTDLIYVKQGTKANGVSLDDKGDECNTYEVYINGEKQTIMIDNLANGDTGATADWYRYSINSAGRYVLDDDVSNVVDTSTLVKDGSATIEAGDGVYYITTGTASSDIKLADATDATVVDLKYSGDQKISSVEELYTAVNPAEGSEVAPRNIIIAFSYSGTSNKVVDIIYVIG